jgi:hypothetical protein
MESNFKFTSLELVNDLFDHSFNEGCIEIFEQAFQCENEKELAGILLYEKNENQRDMGDVYTYTFWNDLDLFSKARWIKTGMVKYGL